MRMIASGDCSTSWGISVRHISTLTPASSSRVWPGLLLGTGSHHDDVGPRRHRDVVGAHDLRHRHELDALFHLEHLGGGLVRIEVEQGDRAGGAPDEARVGDRGADTAGSHDRDAPGAPRAAVGRH